MDYVRRLEPTPTAVRNGRRTIAIFAAFVAVIPALIVLVPGLGDTGMLAITAATCVALVGDAIAYLGQPDPYAISAGPSSRPSGSSRASSC